MPAPKGNKYAQGGPGGGRPPEYQKKYNDIAYKICLMGGTDKDLSEAFDVTEQTINSWKTEHEEFFLALKRGKVIADAKVASSLFERATGYNHPDVDIRVIDGEIIQTELVKHYPPDTAAAIFWLKNRRKKQWRDKIEQGFTDGEGNDINPVHIFKLPDNGRDIETKSDSGN